MKTHKVTCNSSFHGKSQCSTYVMTRHFMSHVTLVTANLTWRKQNKGDIHDFVSVSIIIFFMIWDGRSKEIR